MQIGAIPRNKNVIVIDSGVGGLTIARALCARLPSLDLHYIADEAGFPYGGWRRGQLAGHIGDLLERALHDRHADACVIACNTASMEVLDTLRRRFSLPIIGTVPAIKPAAAATRSGYISVLVTPAAANSPYLRRLIDRAAPNAEVAVVATPGLAGMAEAQFRGQSVDPVALAQELHPAFVEARGQYTDTVVLGCTHYPLLLETLKTVAPWPVKWLEPAPAVAAQVMRVLYPSSFNWGPKPLGRQMSFQTTAGELPAGREARMRELCELRTPSAPADHLIKGAVG